MELLGLRIRLHLGIQTGPMTMGADRDHEGADRHVERVFNPERKDTLWGKRKLGAR